MSAPAAIQATFADFKLVKTRKTAQFIFEVPAEKADDALRALGGLPQSMDERWVAIARLDLSAVPTAPEKPEKRVFADLPIATRAALLCDREAFRRFLAEERALNVIDTEDAASAVRGICGVKSRAEFSTNAIAATKFEKLERDFNDWLSEPV